MTRRSLFGVVGAAFAGLVACPRSLLASRTTINDGVVFADNVRWTNKRIMENGLPVTEHAVGFEYGPEILSDPVRFAAMCERMRVHMLERLRSHYGAPINVWRIGHAKLFQFRLGARAGVE